VSVKPEGSGGFYREEAARLASEAARRPFPPEAAASAVPAYVPPVLTVEPERPLLAPEPATNQNLKVPLAPVTDRDDRQPFGVGRVLARAILLPLYLVVGAVSLGIIGLFVKGLLGL
jgi:hypothetical protein